MLQRGSDLGFLLGHGKGRQVTYLRFTKILRRIRKADSGVETWGGSCSGGVSCMERRMSGTRVWRRGPNAVPVTVQTAVPVELLDSTRDFQNHRSVRCSWWERETLRTMGCFPKLPLLTGELCPHVLVDFHFGFPWAIACMFWGLGEGGILKSVWHLGCICRGVKYLKEQSGS